MAKGGSHHKARNYAALAPPDPRIPRALSSNLGCAERLAALVDPAALARAYARAMARASIRPWATLPVVARYGAGVAATGLATASRALGRAAPEAMPVRGDKRFTDPAWSEDPRFWALVQLHLLGARLQADLVRAGALDEQSQAKADFAASLIGDALAPSNFLLTNPVALREAAATGGRSVLRGLANLLRDVADNDGWPRQVQSSAFEVGRNLAATPGHVVFRNELVEVIQYEPSTDEVHEIPLLVLPPWINRYYIADLAPGKSLVEWAVAHGHTTFTISYRNPDASTRDLDFDDYLRLGPLTALEVARDVTGAPTVNTLAICLGGTMNAVMLAHLGRNGDTSVNSATFLNSALDYRDGGVLGAVFADPSAVDSFETRLAGRGFLEAREMSRTFDLLRANDLVFRYLVDNWLLGQDPPAFDLLAWNADAMRIPGKAHLTFLRRFYLDHAFAEDRMDVFGAPISTSDISTDCYIVAAKDDHIVPWQASYRTTQMVKGQTRFVLTSSGHIAGIVNPPHPKARLWINETLPQDPREWREHATEHSLSWWEDWATWLEARAGARIAPPAIGGGRYTPLCPSPGTYVFG